VENKKVYDLIRAHHMMVMPSIMESESFGVASIEAGACGRPVIAAKVGGVPAVVIEGRNGVLVPPGNVEALAEAIIKLADNISTCRKLGQSGYELVKEKFDWQDSLDKMSELYERLIYESQKS
jgi:glycosyltransferase involved in cell wall biosynthesis